MSIARLNIYLIKNAIFTTTTVHNCKSDTNSIMKFYAAIILGKYPENIANPAAEMLYNSI